MIKLLEQNVQQLQRDLTSAQSERAHFAQQVTARQQELAGARTRVQVLEQEVKRKDDQIKRNDTESASQLQGEKTRHHDTNKQLQDCKKTCSALDKELQGEKTRHQDTAKQLQDSKQTCGALNKDVTSYQRQLRELENKVPPRETSVTLPSRPTHPQAEAFRFHDNHGKNVVLSNNQQTADYRGNGWYGGIVISRDPMEANKLYEVQITKREGRVFSLRVGVVTSSPDSLTLPGGALGWESAVAVCSDGLADHGDKKDSDIGKALKNLPVDSRVGLRIDPSRSLHLHVNGADQGVVPCRSLPDPCWVMWELNPEHTEIISLPMRDLS